MAHVLVVGGTGMLKTVSCFLAEKGNIVTIIARDRGKLHHLSSLVAAQGGKINPISVDYNDLDALSERLNEAVQTYGPVQLAVAWIRAESRPTLIHLANFLNRTSPVCRLFHVCGTQWVEMLNESDDIDNELRPLTKVYYRKILLGSQEEAGEPRRLKRAEINSGIIEALSEDVRIHVIGRIESVPGRAISA